MIFMLITKVVGLGASKLSTFRYVDLCELPASKARRSRFHFTSCAVITRPLAGSTLWNLTPSCSVKVIFRPSLENVRSLARSISMVTSLGVSPLTSLVRWL